MPITRSIPFLAVWLLTFGCSLLDVPSLMAQHPAGAAPAYTRWSVLPLFVDFGHLDASTQSLLSRAAVPARMDRHDIPTLTVKSDFQRGDYRVVNGEALNAEPLYAGSEAPLVNRDQLIASYSNLLSAHKIGHEILARWFDRDEAGHFSVYGTFAERAGYDAAEVERLRGQGSILENAALMEEAARLVDQTYVLVTDLEYLETMAQYYDRVGPSDQSLKGYRAAGQVHVFQLDFSDSIQQIFWHQLWSEPGSSASTAERKAAFEAMDFPFQYLTSFAVSGEGTKSKQAPDSKRVIAYGRWLLQTDEKLKEEAMEEFCAGLGESFLQERQQQARREAGITDEPGTLVQGKVTSLRPLSSDIGSREGLKQDASFYLIAEKEKRSGDTLRKKVGLVRVANLGQNDGVSLAPEATTFYQLSGKAPAVGMSLEQAPMLGLELSYNHERSLRGGMSGPSLRLDFPFLRLLSGPNPSRLGVYSSFHLDLTANTRPEIEADRTFVSELSLISYSVNRGPNQTLYWRWAVGLTYEQYFLRKFHAVVNLGYADESTTALEGITYSLRLSQSMLELGGSLGYSLRPRVQLQGGLIYRGAADEPEIRYRDRIDEEYSASFAIPNTTYSDIFPGRGSALSAFFGLRFLL